MRRATSRCIITVMLSKQPASMKAVSSGVVTLYGRFAHTTGRSPPRCSRTSSGRFCFSTSPNMISTLSQPASVSASTGFRLLSSSTHSTLPARFDSCSVRQPTPGPTSSTPVFSSSSAPSAISSGTQPAVRKFCPMDFENRKPCRESRARISFISVRFMRSAPRRFDIPQPLSGQAQDYQHKTADLCEYVGLHRKDKYAQCEQTYKRPDYRRDEIFCVSAFHLQPPAIFLILSIFS